MSQTCERSWNYELVGVRLIEAASTVRRMPMRMRPKAFGTIWPVFAQEEVGADTGRVIITPSGREIERADAALGWVLRYLFADPDAARVVGHWANVTDDIHLEEIPEFVVDGLKIISRGLRRDRVPFVP